MATPPHPAFSVGSLLTQPGQTPGRLAAVVKTGQSRVLDVSGSLRNKRPRNLVNSGGERCERNDMLDHCGAGDASGTAAMHAQDASTAPAQNVTPQTDVQSSAKTMVPLKVALTLARYQGDKKISSAPYTLWVTANDRQTTNLRMGVEMPVASGPSVNYRNVGTSIDSTRPPAPARCTSSHLRSMIRR